MESFLQRLDTERTWMRPFLADDLKDAFSWFGDPEVMKFIPTGVDRTLEDGSRRVANYIEHQAKNGFSKWIVISRDTGKAIGDAGLYHLPDGERVELGYRLSRLYWGQGLATELARAWVDAAFRWYGLFEIYAFALPENEASQRVMQKAGFSYLRHETFYGFDCPLYRLRRVDTLQ